MACVQCNAYAYSDYDPKPIVVSPPGMPRVPTARSVSASEIDVRWIQVQAHIDTDTDAEMRGDEMVITAERQADRLADRQTYR
jgi:hypothetical protein